MSLSATTDNMLTVPTKRMGELLTSYGKEATWKALLVNLGKAAYPHAVSHILTDENFMSNLAPTSENLLNGLTFGQVAVLYEYSLAHTDHQARKDAGQYFTPDDISALMVRLSDKFTPKKTWLDPCSGIGNLAFWLTNAQDNPEQFLLNNLILVDRDSLALTIARVLFTFEYQDKNVNLFHDLKNRFHVRDFLTEEELPPYDYAILNPPYVRAPKNPLFLTSESHDLYAYFLEKIATTAEGFISITPQSFTNGSNFNELRKLVMNFQSVDLITFDNVPDAAFKGVKFGSKNTNKSNSTRAAILVARKTEDTSWNATPLLRWTAKNRQTMLQEAPQHLTPALFTEKFFLKSYPTLKDFQESALSWTRTLSDFLVDTPTQHKLVVPGTPRYYISAVKRDLNRTSSHLLYFKDENDMNLIYPILNSTLPYWWWRVREGGLCLTRKTLLSTPIPDDLTTPELSHLTQLEESETTNLTVKMNAGKEIQNVKHTTTLIETLNGHYFGENTSTRLIRIQQSDDTGNHPNPANT